MPAAAEGHPVHHVRGPQLNVVLRQGVCEHRAQLPVFLVAPGAVRAVGVDDHRDHGLGFGGGRDRGQVAHPVGHLLGQIDPQHGPHFAAVQRHQDQ